MPNGKAKKEAYLIIRRNFVCSIILRSIYSDDNNNN